MTAPTASLSLPRTDRSLRWSAAALVGVGILFFALTTAVMTVHGSFSTDEVDYLAQVTPANPHLIWSAVRAWGVPVLVAPAALFSPSDAVIRVYMTTVLAIGLVGAFWTWRTIVGPVVAPLAALLFATVFTTTLYGDAVMPNLPVALAAVAATGLLARLAGSTRRRLVLGGVAAMFAALALLRPTDSLLVAVPALVCVLAFRDRRRLDTVIAVVAGEVVGWLPWIIEAYISFGGPVARWKAGGNSRIHGLHLGGSMFDIYPRLFDQIGALCCYGRPAATAGPAATTTVVWFIAVPILAVLGLAMAITRRQLADLTPPLLAAAAFVVFYLVLLDYGSPRFLLPIFALLSIPIAYGLVSFVTEAPRSLRPVAVAVCLLAVAAHLGVQARYDVTKRDGIVATRQHPRERAQALQAYLPRGRPCLVIGNKPQVIAYYLRCHAAVLANSRRGTPPPKLRQSERRGWAVLAFLGRARAPAGSFLHSWRSNPVRAPGTPLYAYTPPSQPEPA